MTVVGVVLERRAAPRAIAGRGREAAAAVGAELRVGFRARAVAGARGKWDTGNGRRWCRRLFGSERRNRFGGVAGSQGFVVCIRELTCRAIEFDLLQGPQRDGSRRQVVIGIVSFIHVSRFPILVSRHLGSQDRLEDEEHRSRSEQDPRDQLEHAR